MSKSRQAYKFYDRGVSKFTHELDIESILSSTRKANILASLLLSEHQKVLT